MADCDSTACVVCGEIFAHVASKPRKYCSIKCYRVAQRAGGYKRGHGPDFPSAPCSHCGNTVERKRSQRRSGEQADNVFCDRRCYDAFRTKSAANRAIDCGHCNQRFVPDIAQRKYCCYACRVAAKKAVAKNCLNCECLFSPVRPQKATGKFVSYTAGKTCCAKCANEWIRNNPERKRKIGNAFKGAKHPNWQGGKSQLNNVSSRGPNWPKQRLAALKRDKYRCVDCGMSDAECRERFSRGLDVDHVVPFHNFNNYRKANALTNLQCRCASCHRIAESTRSMVQMVLPMQDSVKRRHKGGSARGEKINTAKLTANDVLIIRRRAASGDRAFDIHKAYPRVAKQAVWAIIHRKTWRHI